LTAAATPSATDAIVGFASGAWGDAHLDPRERGARSSRTCWHVAIAGAHDRAVEVTLATRDRGEPRLGAHLMGRASARERNRRRVLNAVAAGTVASPATPVVCAALAAG